MFVHLVFAKFLPKALPPTVIDATSALIINWMSKFNPLTMVLSSFLIIFMDRGASEISTTFGLNHSYSDILTGIILFFIIGCEFFISYKLQFRKKAEKEEQ